MATPKRILAERGLPQMIRLHHSAGAIPDHAPTMKTTTATPWKPEENGPWKAEDEGTRFVSRRDVAKLFGVSASTITRWARTGLITAVRTPGGHYRFRAEDVLREVRAAERGEEKAS
jgi:excisionase family DNA binding protein